MFYATDGLGTAIAENDPGASVTQVPNVLVMSPEAADRLGVKGLADLVAYAKKNPGSLN